MTVSDNRSAPGRPREFDIEAAVESAMQVFWTRGYNGTSLVDLIDGTGLSRGSLYKAFGDKHGLFLCALDRYISVSSVQLINNLRKPGSVKAALRETLSRFAQLSCAADGSRGCMLVATATEMAPYDAGVAERVKAMLDRVRDAYAAAIKRGQASGEIPARHDAESLAGLVVCLTQGMRVVGKIGPTEKQMAAVVNTAMALFD